MTKGTVVLTKEQARLIDEVLAINTKSGLVAHHSSGVHPWGVSRWALNTMSLDDFIRALYVGYTVEKTQEEREADVKAYYDSEGIAFINGDWYDELKKGRCQGVRKTLTLLGITIARVND